MISHPEKVLFPDDGITKGELASYYDAIAPLMLPHLRGRPVTMERFPAGIGKAGFIQKDVSKGFPVWLERVEVPKSDGTVHHPLASDARSLLWLANQNCITPHVWTSRVPDLFNPDICVFDLDPSIEDLDGLRQAALHIRDLLDVLGLPSWVKTSGSKGFHIVVPLDRKLDFDAVASFAARIARLLVYRYPDLFTTEFAKADRGDRILLDTWRNGYSATFASVYAVRARPGAPISIPCTWQEIEDAAVEPQSFNLRNIAERIADVGELWGDLWKRPRSLTRALSRLEKEEAAETANGAKGLAGAAPKRPQRWRGARRQGQ